MTALPIVIFFFVCLTSVASQATEYDLSPSWTIEMPLPYSRALAQAFLHAHNVRRANPPRATANMRKLVWNSSLVEAAARHVRNCVFEHDTQNFTIGQTLELGGTLELNVAKANATLTTWVERDIVKHPMQANGHMTLNFASQVLWAETASVGCASHWCPNVVKNGNGVTGVFTACNYYPPGNIPNQPVVRVGPPCSKCPPEAGNCDNTLCTNESYTFASNLAVIDPSIPV